MDSNRAENSSYIRKKSEIKWNRKTEHSRDRSKGRSNTEMKC